MITEKEIEMKLEEYKGLIISTANRFIVYGMDFDDIFQELCMEFVKVLRIHDEDGGASIKTLFITYAKNWLRVKLKSLNYQKRGIPLRIDDRDIDDDGKYSFMISNDIAPDEAEYYERMLEDIKYFLSRHKWGYVFLAVEDDEKTFREIAQEDGISFQAIGKRYQKVKGELLKYLKERGYKL